MTKNESCDSMHESVKSFKSSMDNSYFGKDKNDIPSKEVLCKEEVICCSMDSGFWDCHINGTAAISFSNHPVYDQNLGEETCDEVLLSVDKILELLAHDLERYANVSLDAHVVPCGIPSQGEVISPRFDVEFDIKSEYLLSSFGGVCDNRSSINTHDDYSNKESTNREKFHFVSDYYHANYTKIGFEYNKEAKARSDKSDSEFSLYVDDKFKVHSNELFDEDYNQHDLCQNFHDSFSDLVNN